MNYEKHLFNFTRTIAHAYFMCAKEFFTKNNKQTNNYEYR